MSNSEGQAAGPPARPLEPGERQATVDRLCEHFAHDSLNATELERRLDLAYAARTRAELILLERDLPALGVEDDRAGASGPSAAAAAPPVAVDPGRPPAERDFIVSAWGATERKGAWTPARRLHSLTVMGGTDLDFREAVLATREISVRLVTVMGAVDVVVPPGVRVEWNGIALMGGVSTPEHMAPPPADAPVIRISGLVIMGGVDVVERLPGESAREARKRRKAARKARRRLDSGA